MDVNKITVLDFAGILFLQNLNRRKKIEILHLYTRVGNLDYVVNKLTARWVKSCAEASLRNHLFLLALRRWDVSRETSPAAKSEEKRMFSQAMQKLADECYEIIRKMLAAVR